MGKVPRRSCQKSSRQPSSHKLHDLDGHARRSGNGPFSITLKVIQATVAGSRCNCHEFTQLSVHTTNAMHTSINLLSAQVQMFVLFYVAASVPYTPMGQGSSVDRSPSVTFQKAHIRSIVNRMRNGPRRWCTPARSIS